MGQHQSKGQKTFQRTTFMYQSSICKLYINIKVTIKSCNQSINQSMDSCSTCSLLNLQPVRPTAFKVNFTRANTSAKSYSNALHQLLLRANCFNDIASFTSVPRVIPSGSVDRVIEFKWCNSNSFHY